MQLFEELLDKIHLPCGGTAYFDDGSGCSHRCECGATVGSIGMPKRCKEAEEKYVMLKLLGSKAYWDYDTGEEKFHD